MSEAEEEPDEAMDEPAPAKRDGSFILNAPKSPNLAFDQDETTLARMGAKVCEEFEIDVASRKAEGYEERLEQAVKLASLAKEAKNTPWENASNVKFPLIIQAAIQFNARSYAAVIRGPDVIRGSSKGAPSPEKQGRAERVGKHMSWQLLEEEEEWEEDTDALLLRLPIVGTLVRKTYFDPSMGRNCSHVLGPDEFVVNYKAKRDLSSVPRMTQVLRFYPHEIIEKRRSGLWLDVDLGQASDAANDDHAPHEFLEQHRLWDLDEDGYPEPYIVTVHKETQKVVRIVARWYEDGVKTNAKGEIYSIKPYECFTKYGFIPSPDGSFYDLGFGTLLGPLSDTINTALNQTMDAATLSNLQGGFIAAGTGVKSGALRFKPGEWKKVEGVAGNLSQNIVPLPTKEPSAVLFNLIQFLIETGKELTATQDILTGEAGKGTLPVGTVQALVEQGLKTFTAIVKRVYRALKREARVRFVLNGRYLEPEVYFEFQDKPIQVIRDDYLTKDLNVVPDADPNMATDLQEMTQAQFVLELIPTGQIDPRKAVDRALRAAKVSDPESLMTPEGPPPVDPKVEIEKAKVRLEADRLDIEEVKVAADIEKSNAEAAQIRLETWMAGPEMAAMLDRAVQAGIQAALDRVTNGGQPQVQPQQLPGVEGPPGNGALPPIPRGLPPGAGPLMDDGAGDGPPLAMPGGDGGGPPPPGMGAIG